MRSRRQEHIIIKRITAVLWWIGTVCLALAVFSFVQGYRAESHCKEYNAELRVEVERRHNHTPAPDCKPGGEPGTLVPVCDLPDDVLFDIYKNMPYCEENDGWLLVGASAILFFVIAFVLGGSLLRPPKL
jgi:hypothetical protein